jgi:hypothetical protein
VGAGALTCSFHFIPSRDPEFAYESKGLSGSFDNCFKSVDRDHKAYDQLVGVNYFNSSRLDLRDPTELVFPPVSVADVVEKLSPNAKVIFLAACSLQSSVFDTLHVPSPVLSLSDIHDQYVASDGTVVPATQRRAIIKSDGVSTDIAIAAQAWIGTEKKLTAGECVRDAIQEVNAVYGSLPTPQTFSTVGDANVVIVPSGKCR